MHLELIKRASLFVRFHVALEHCHSNTMVHQLLLNEVQVVPELGEHNCLGRLGAFW